MGVSRTVFSIGPSTRTIPDFVSLLGTVTPTTLTPGALVLTDGTLRYPAPVVDDGDLK
jgi:hypothetical protein